eukprot:scaffold139695_cov19-Tisochrysis_lutea.AAC.2
MQRCTLAISRSLPTFWSADPFLPRASDRTGAPVNRRNRRMSPNHPLQGRDASELLGPSGRLGNNRASINTHLR